MLLQSLCKHRCIQMRSSWKATHLITRHQMYGCQDDLYLPPDYSPKSPSSISYNDHHSYGFQTSPPRGPPATPCFCGNQPTVFLYANEVHSSVCKCMDFPPNLEWLWASEKRFINTRLVSASSYTWDTWK
ncbi:hypothetical protein FKM82_002186 [Ascaphus truei]